MDKTTINYLISKGFSIEEIMKMENPEADNKSAENKDNKPAEIKNENTDKKEEVPAKTKSVEELLSDLKAEISDMRTQIHNSNRMQNVIEPEIKQQLSFEEDIEKMIEEVNK